MNGAFVPDLLLFMSSLQPQTIAEKQTDPLTDFHALGAMKHPKETMSSAPPF